MTSSPHPPGRRPLKSRDRTAIRALAAWLAARGASPNSISVAGMVFAALGLGAFLLTAHAEAAAERWLWVAAAAFIQLRLLANVLDGLVAVEGGKGGPCGDLYNEVPDRFSDAASLVGAGYALGGSPVAGWCAALLAVGVAYTRALGASLGAGQAFHGPMAKPHRMFALTCACLFMAVLPEAWRLGTQPGLIGIALWIIAVGCAPTLWRRLRWIAARLAEARPPTESAPDADDKESRHG